jgi:hypothetical protein
MIICLFSNNRRNLFSVLLKARKNILQYVECYLYASLWIIQQFVLLHWLCEPSTPMPKVLHAGRKIPFPRTKCSLKNMPNPTETPAQCILPDSEVTVLQPPRLKISSLALLNPLNRTPHQHPIRPLAPLLRHPLLNPQPTLPPPSLPIPPLNVPLHSPHQFTRSLALPPIPSHESRPLLAFPNK